jgi:hypothetical protein
MAVWRPELQPLSGASGAGAINPSFLKRQIFSCSWRIALWLC